MAAGVTAVLVAITACGGSTSSSSSVSAAPAAATQSGSSGNSALAAAEATVSQYSKLPSPIVLPAVGKPIPKGATVDLLTVATPSIQYQNAGVAAAAKALGWKVNTITPPETPEGYSSALSSIVQEKPTALIYFTPFPLSSVDAQLKQLKAAGVPVFTLGANGYPVGGSSPVVADGSGANEFIPLAKMVAQMAIADAKGAPDAAWVTDPSVPAWKPMATAYKGEIEAAGGRYNEIDVPLASIGKDAPTRIVSFLQAHPDVKYVGLVIGPFDLGLSQALQAAGLAGKFKFYVSALSAPDVAAIKAGQVNGGVAIETTTGAWRLVDLAARTLAHAPLPYVHLPTKFLIVTKSNVALAANITAFPGDNSVFLKAWGVS
jgi:ribose transport system substrate-binding protein